MRFGADGRYAAHSYASVSAGDMSSVSEDTEDGSWSADGNTLTMSPNRGAAYQVELRFDGGLLYLGGNKYVPCR